MGNLTVEHHKAWADELDLFDRVPVLAITSGFGRRSAKDERGLDYIEFEEEYGPPEIFFDDDGLGIRQGDSKATVTEELIEHYDELYHPQCCTICQEPVNVGWMCLDGGEVYHRGCVAEK